MGLNNREGSRLLNDWASMVLMGSHAELRTGEHDWNYDVTTSAPYDVFTIRYLSTDKGLFKLNLAESLRGRAPGEVKKLLHGDGTTVFQMLEGTLYRRREGSL